MRDDLGCVDLFHLVFIEIRRGLVAVIPMLASSKLPERILCQILVILCESDDSEVKMGSSDPYRSHVIGYYRQAMRPTGGSVCRVNE